ncbi:MAG TPA: hypothetical protein VLF69_05395 [Candidatus Saccharimonadales bacterium]|nr:hypothetical protein [Candidatus Saccharimonadales bacterium]
MYDAIVSLVLVQGAGPQTGLESPLHHFFKVLPPGEFIINAEEYPGGGMHTKPGIELAFTDKSGAHWLKDKSGTLTELSKPPDQYYSIAQPIGWLYLDDDVQ